MMHEVTKQEGLNMNTQTQIEMGRASAGSLRHRAQFSLGVIMVPALHPRKRFTQSTLERQLEMLRLAVVQQTKLHRVG